MAERSGDRKETYVPPTPENMKPKASRDNAVEMAAGGEHERAALETQREKMAGSPGATGDPGRTDNPYGTGVGYAGEGSTAYGAQEGQMGASKQDQGRTDRPADATAAPRRQPEQQHQQSSSGQKPGPGSESQQSMGGKPPTQGAGSTPQSHTAAKDARPQNAQSSGQGGTSTSTPVTSQTATERGTVADKGTIGATEGKSGTSGARDALASVHGQGAGSGSPQSGSPSSGTSSSSTAQGEAGDVKDHVQAKAGDLKEQAWGMLTEVTEHPQERIGEVKAQAQGKLDAVATQAQDTLESVKANLQSKTDQLKGTVTDKTDLLKETMTGKTDQLLGTVGEKGGQVKQAANDKTTQAGEKLTGLAGTLREKTGTMEPDHPVATAATKAAGALEQTGSYLQEHTPDDWMTDLKALIARKPLESVLVAAGLGYMAARAFRK